MKKILIIDDEGIGRDSLSIVLSQRGYAVELAADGETGLERLRSFRPDVVILDRDLPKMTGSEVLKRLKKILPSAYVIVLTGFAESEAKEKYMKLGAAEFLSKGAGVDVLLNCLESRFRAANGARPEPKPVIVVADDDPAVRRLLSRFLTDKDYQVLSATNGKEAVALFKQCRPALILLDIRMPAMDGVEALKAIRADDDQAAVAMITGLDDMETAKLCMSLGAYDYIAKPFDFDYLETSVLSKAFLKAG